MTFSRRVSFPLPWKNCRSEKMQCVSVCGEKGGRHRNHFFSSHIISLILVMSDALEAVLSKRMAYK